MPRRSIRPWLKKWYLDCITREGDCVLGYSGSVRAGPVWLGVTSVLVGSESGPVTPRWRLLDSSTPEVTGSGELRWRTRRLEVEGSWTPVAAGAPRVLHESDAARITWQCTVPGGRARVRIGGREFDGAGYAEHLSVAGDPEALGLRELLWGHFSGPSTHLVWLAWRGRQSLTLVLRNGREVPEARVLEPDRVVADGYRLTACAPRVLSASVLPDALPGALRLLTPRSLRGVGEQKWIAAACLDRQGGPSEPGWAIYELVTWP